MFTGLDKTVVSELVMTPQQAKELLLDWAKESPDGSDIAVQYIGRNPKRKISGQRFASYMNAKSIKSAIEKGSTRGDLIWDLSHGFFTRVYPEKKPADK